MALTNFGGSSEQTVTISCYASTGYTVDHFPLNHSQIDAHKAIVTNANARIVENYDIASIRVAMPAAYAPSIDYIKVQTTNTQITKQHSGNDITWGYMSWAPYTDTAYYIVTGYSDNNKGVVTFSLLLDYVATLGIDIKDYGGFITRCPVASLASIDDTVDPNVLVEPFTQSFPTKKRYKLLNIDDFKASDNTNAMQLHVVLTPYDLEYASKHSDLTTASAPAGEVSLAYEVGNTLEYDENELSSKDALSGFQIYDATKKGMAVLYGLGIDNAVADAWSPYVAKLNVTSPAGSDSTYIKDLPGFVGSIAYTPQKYGEDGTISEGFDASTLNAKQKQYGRYFVLISMSSGESQTIAYSDCYFDGDGNIEIDLATDPTPNGCAYMRIRDKDTNNSQLGNYIPRAMWPGGVKSATWPRVPIMLTGMGFGVSLGGTWRGASLDLDAYTAGLNQKAIEAEYNVVAGNGYLYSSTRNTYGLERISESNRHGTEMANIAHSERITGLVKAGAEVIASGVQAGATMMAVPSAIMGGNEAYTTAQNNAASALQNARDSVFDFADVAINAYYGKKRSDENLQNLTTYNEISAREFTEGGLYANQLLNARKNASEALADAQAQKIEMLQRQIDRTPGVPIMSTESRGLLQRNVGQYMLVDCLMDDRDVSRLQKSMEIFGTSVYAPNNGLAVPTDGKWHFYQLSIPGDTWGFDSTLAGTGGPNCGAPSWMIKGAVSQLQGGFWIKANEATTT